MSFIEILKSQPVYPGYPALSDRTKVNKIRYQYWVTSRRPPGLVIGLYDHPNCLKGIKLNLALDDRADITRNFHKTNFVPSFTGEYPRDKSGRPIHPYAEEILAAGLGLEGPGAYWNYGPNLCADPIVLGASTDGFLKTIVIERTDTGIIALPGGFCNPGENPEITASRELHEETTVDLLIKDLLRIECVFEGIVPDARTTLNAWPETSAIAIILYPGKIDHYHPKGRDDARKAFKSNVDDKLFQLLDPAHAEYVRLAIDFYKTETGIQVAHNGAIPA